MPCASTVANAMALGSTGSVRSASFSQAANSGYGSGDARSLILNQGLRTIPALRGEPDGCCVSGASSYSGETHRQIARPQMAVAAVAFAAGLAGCASLGLPFGPDSASLSLETTGAL